MKKLLLLIDSKKKLNQPKSFVHFFYELIFAKYEFSPYLACIYFRECLLKENFACFNFAKSTKLREICENTYTRKLLRLRQIKIGDCILSCLLSILSVWFFILHFQFILLDISRIQKFNFCFVRQRDFLETACICNICSNCESLNNKKYGHIKSLKRISCVMAISFYSCREKHSLEMNMLEMNIIG